MLEWIRSVFDATAFMSRDSCGAWTPGWRALAISIDVICGVSHLCIPVILVLLWLIKRRVYGRVSWTLLFLAGAIAGEGVYHLCQIASWWWPAHKLFVLMSIPGATCSLATAVGLPAIWWHFHNLPTPRELFEINEALEIALRDKSEIADRLAAERHAIDKHVLELEDLCRLRIWNTEQRDHLDALLVKLEKERP